MWPRIAAVFILVLGLVVGYFVYQSEAAPSSFAFKLGLDLKGGTHLVYQADLSEVASGEEADAMSSLRDVVERRTNLFGVAEPLVQIERSGALGTGAANRLIVELPGITDVAEAVKAIGATPLLEFKLVVQGFEQNIILEDGSLNPDAFVDTGLTGRYLERASLQFGDGSGTGLQNEPVVLITFNGEGSELFAKITSSNVGRLLAIFLDGELQSAPIIRQEITGGSAVISGNFAPDEARELVRNLNFGALPVPISLVSTQTIGAALGEEATQAGVFAGVVGLIAVAVFLMLWYRLPGIVAATALLLYIILMLALFKLVPVVLTAAGIAGFILSIGLAVDANILIFERMKEELRAGKNLERAIQEGFSRAWLAIRDSNITHIIAGVILFWFGTSLIEGFALVFTVGTIVSMISAITISRTFLLALRFRESRLARVLFGSGF